MQLLDVENKIHLDFTYEMLKQRASKDFIEITIKKFKMPSFEEHVNYLKENIINYKFFYLIFYKDIPFAEIFINKSYELGIYQHFTNLKKIRNTTSHIRSKNDNVVLYDIFHKILKKHKADTPYILGRINANNTLSINGIKKLGFTKLYECYILKND